MGGGGQQGGSEGLSRSPAEPGNRNTHFMQVLLAVSQKNSQKAS